jgi:hypothetical protein
MPNPTGVNRHLTFNQLHYRANPDYQEAQKTRARARYALLKREGGAEFRLVQIRKELYQARQIIEQHLDAVEYQEKKLDALVREADEILRARRQR